MRERDSCSSRDSHKSGSASAVSAAVSRRSSVQEEAAPKLRLGSRQEGGGRAEARSQQELSSETDSRTPKSRGSGSFVGSGAAEELRLFKHDLVSSSPEEKDKRSVNIYPSMSRIEKVLGKDVSDEPIDFRALRQDIRQLERETIRRRQEIVRPNGGGEVWAELKGGILSSGRESALSPAPALGYRSLRSLTPEDGDDSTSFHESFEKDLVRRRRRRRSASCSSGRCCETPRPVSGAGQSRRGLDSAQSRSTHSVTGASSRNSSSRSEKSSTRSSRSPSIEHLKQGR